MSTLIGTESLVDSMKYGLNLLNRVGFACAIMYPKRVHELGLILTWTES